MLISGINFGKWLNLDATRWKVVKIVVMRFQPEYERHWRFNGQHQWWTKKWIEHGGNGD